MLATPLRSVGLNIDADMDRTGAMTDVDTERGGTVREAAERVGTEVLPGREPGFDNVRVLGCAIEDGFASFAVAADTGGRDSVMEVDRVTEF